MSSQLYRIASLLLLAVGLTVPAAAENYIRLKSGQTVSCAILSQDSSVVYTTSWEYRGLKQPPLQVYSRDEIESIWFEKPTDIKPKRLYQPHPGGYEGGGGFSFQTWAETDVDRAYLGVLAVHGGYTISKPIGIELESAFTFPGGAKGTAWRAYKVGYQVSLGAIVHPVQWKGMVPYLLVGGGGMLGTPLENVQLEPSSNLRSLLNLGVGIKWGSDGMGYRLEWRHSIYSWTGRVPLEWKDGDIIWRGDRAEAMQGNMTSVRASIFFYR
jgi:hypothetical protein